MQILQREIIGSLKIDNFVIPDMRGPLIASNIFQFKHMNNYSKSVRWVSRCNQCYVTCYIALFHGVQRNGVENDFPLTFGWLASQQNQLPINDESDYGFTCTWKLSHNGWCSFIKTPHILCIFFNGTSCEKHWGWSAGKQWTRRKTVAFWWTPKSPWSQLRTTAM